MSVTASSIAGEDSFDRAVSQQLALQKRILTLKAQVVVYGTELWGNKLDGLRIKQMRCHFMKAKVKQNLCHAIFMESLITEQMLKIYSTGYGPKRLGEIEGKISGDWGTPLLTIMAQDNVAEILEELRKE